MPFVECTAAAANCAINGLAARATAARLWYAWLEPDAGARAQANAVAERLAGAVPGRVQAAGVFEDAALSAALRRALPRELGAALRPRFEWYGCRGAFFHNDAHFGDVLFGVWCLAGPARDLVFARLARRVPMAVGAAVVFDPFEPHGLLNPSAVRYDPADYAGAPISVFLGFELALDTATRAVFGIGAPKPAAPLLSSSVAVHPETGALAGA